MDEETKDLIVQLCTRAAMIMEDVSSIALHIGSQDPGEIAASLRHLTRAGETIMALLRAARVLAAG